MEDLELPIRDFWNKPMKLGAFIKQIEDLIEYCKSYDKVMGNDSQNSVYLEKQSFLENSLKFVKNHANATMRMSVSEQDYHSDAGYDKGFEKFIDWLSGLTYKKATSSSIEDKKVESFKDAFEFIQYHLKEIKNEIIPQKIIDKKDADLRKKKSEIDAKEREIKDLKNNLLVAKSVDNNTVWMIRFGWIATITAFLTNLDFVELFPKWSFSGWFHLIFNGLFAIASGFFLFFFWNRFRPQNSKK